MLQQLHVVNVFGFCFWLHVSLHGLITHTYMCWFRSTFCTCMCFRYASLFFLAGIEREDNELIMLEIIHRYVEIMDMYFGNVSFCCWLNYFVSSRCCSLLCMTYCMLGRRLWLTVKFNCRVVLVFLMQFIRPSLAICSTLIVCSFCNALQVELF